MVGVEQWGIKMINDILIELIKLLGKIRLMFAKGTSPERPPEWCTECGGVAYITNWSEAIGYAKENNISSYISGCTQDRRYIVADLITKCEYLDSEVICDRFIPICVIR